MEARFYAERLESLKKQFQTERETAKKAALRESAEVSGGDLSSSKCLSLAAVRVTSSEKDSNEQE